MLTPITSRALPSSIAVAMNTTLTLESSCIQLQTLAGTLISSGMLEYRLQRRG